MQGLNEINPRAAEIEESNALALAIITNGRLAAIWLCNVLLIFYEESISDATTTFTLAHLMCVYVQII